MAVILPILIMMLAVPLFLGHVFWLYSVGQKAAHGAARYLSMASQAEMRTPGGGFSEANVAATARWIAQQELEGILPFTDGVRIQIQCNGIACGAVVPTSVRVKVQISMHDALLADITSYFVGATGMVVAGDVTMR